MKSFFYYPKTWTICTSLVINEPYLNREMEVIVMTLKPISRFSVYKHQLVIDDNRLITRKFIVLKDVDGFIRFTDFHKYIKPRNYAVRTVSDDGNRRFDFVVKLLNYAFFFCGIKSLSDLSVSVVQDFLNNYGKGTLPNDTRKRSKSTVESCITAIMDFLEVLIRDKDSGCSIKINDLYKRVPYRDKRGITREKKVPIFDVFFISDKRHIFRDMPDAAFEMLFERIASHHPDLLMLVTLSAFAGLRPSEACNVRRTDSNLGSGILFDEYDGNIQKIQIDLRSEQCLRSDLKSTGRIKKERLQTVPLMFTDAFADSYENYMKYIKGKKYESDFGALTVNKQGKAITYDSYYQKFRRIIKEEMIPLYLKSNNEETVIYGHLLLENNISPHIFRHWYTVQLVLAGIDNIAELMEARGDSSPESSLVYLQNKGELEKQYRKVNSGMYDYLSWAANKKFNERGLK